MTNTSAPSVTSNSSADLSGLFAALNQGPTPEPEGNEAETSLALPTPEGFTAWEQVLDSFNDMELSQDNTVATNSINDMLEGLDDEELIELPRVSPVAGIASDVGYMATGAFGNISGVKPDPETENAQAIVPAGATFGGAATMPTSPVFHDGRTKSSLLAPSIADITAARSGTTSPTSMFDFAASLDAIPRRLDKDVAPNALVPYTGGQKQEKQLQLPQWRRPALTASAEQWESAASALVPVTRSYPDRIEDLTESQLASIDRKALLKMMVAEKYTDKQKDDIKKKRRLYKNRISAKGSIIKKKKEQRNLTMVNTHLIRTVDELQKQNQALQHANKQLEQHFSAAQELARQRDHEKAQYEQKIAELTAMLNRLEPSA